MSKATGTSTALIVAAVIVIALGLGYFLLAGHQDAAPRTPAETEDTTQQTPAADAVTPETPDDTTSADEPSAPTPVVPTKTLNLPSSKVTVPTAPSSDDPAVEAMMESRTIGRDDAPIKVVEYSSLTCSHCAEFHKNDFAIIKAEYIDTGKVQFIFKEFPLNKPAMDASKLLRCLPRERYDSFMSLLFAQQDKWAFQEDYITPLKQNAKLAGLSEDQVESCLNNKALEGRLAGDMKAATETYKIQATPSFIVNNGAKTIAGHQPVQFFRDTFDGILGTSSAQPATATPDSQPHN